MSDAQNHTTDTAHDNAHEDHTGPVKTPVQLLWAVIASFVIPVFAIIGLVFFVYTQYKPQAGGDANASKAVEMRIAKVGTVEVKDGSGPLATGETVYKAQCAACHAAGSLGSPKFEDKAAWGARNAKGYAALLKSALEGKGQMPKQAGGEYDDIEIGRAVVYMTNAAGAKFAVPERPAK